MLNVSAGIGVIGMASPMLQEIFGGALIGRPELGFTDLTPRAARAWSPAIAAGFTGLLSLFNIGGRFFWASLSDYIGRKNTYYTFFLLGIALYALRAVGRACRLQGAFVLAFGIILSMYGGGFATVPAYLADIFGTQFVGAIHGRLLTAWSTAGIIGPVVVNYIREFEIAAGVPRDHVYDVTMYILAGMLVGGLVCNYADQAARRQVVHAARGGGGAAGGTATATGRRRVVRHRQGRPRPAGRPVLGLRGHPDRLGRVGDAAERGEDLLTDPPSRVWRDHSGAAVSRLDPGPFQYQRMSFDTAALAKCDPFPIGSAPLARG